jgi:hypothetical protein
MSYIIKAKANEELNKLVLDAWNSIKTRTYYNSTISKEGITL